MTRARENLAKLLIILLIFSMSDCSKIKSSPKGEIGAIYTGVDDVLEALKVNGQHINFSGNANGWNLVRSAKTNLSPGDKVEITGRNLGGPAAIVAAVIYTDEEGKQQTLVTSGDWACDGKKPELQGDNATSNWVKIRGRPYENIPSHAQFIWARGAQQTTCSVVIPKKSKSFIYLTTDDIVEKLTVNGKEVNVDGATGDWTAVNLAQVDFGPGDIVEINGRNTGGPGAMVATLTYEDEEGKTQTLSTGSDWSCDQRSPTLLGLNGNPNTLWVKGIGPMPHIAGDAQYIWYTDKQKPTTSCSIQIPKKSNNYIHVTADDVLVKIAVNNKEVPLNGALIDLWAPKVIYADFGPGDKVEIMGRNNGKVTDSNPAGIMATLTYLGEDGKPQKINTGAGWACEGFNASLQGENQAKNTKWSGHGPVSKIAGNAQWIWSPNKESTVTCSFIIPKKTMSSIYVTVDNVLDSITINGKSVTLGGAANDWTASKVFNVDFGEGDTIEITGHNAGGKATASNPAGIVATLNYIDANGTHKSLNTDSSWQCDGKAPLLQGANNNNNVWIKNFGKVIPDVKGEAQWIWKADHAEKTTCSILIPKTVQVNPTISSTPVKKKSCKKQKKKLKK